MNVHIKRLLLGVVVILILYFPLRISMDKASASVLAALIGFFIAMVLGPVFFKK